MTLPFGRYCASALLHHAQAPCLLINFSASGVEDMHRELRLYNDALVAGMVTSAAEAASRQRPALAADLGLAPLDHLNDSASLPHRIAFLNDLQEQVGRRRGLWCDGLGHGRRRARWGL